MPPYTKQSPTRVAIVGAGIGGLILAIKLKQQLGYENFTIFEKGPDVGGTWRDNTYPVRHRLQKIQDTRWLVEQSNQGCSSDTHMVWFSLSTDAHDWSHSHGYSRDIQAYWIELTRKYDLYPRIRSNTKVTHATWDDNGKVYHIIVEDVLTGEKDSFDAEVLVSAIGILEVPRFPNIPGLESFKGQTWHSAGWNHKHELKDKKVAVIGTGASATQLVPCISEDPTVQVTQFCRTPSWLFPPFRVEYSKFHRWFVRYMPLVQRFSRYTVYFLSEMIYLAVFAGYPSLSRRVTNITEAYIRSRAPEKYVDQLIPKYPIGCKRLLLDTNYLAALHRPNLTLNSDGIERIVEDGIVTKNGNRNPSDVIIFATGFITDKFPLQVQGRRGTIQDYFDEKDGPQAYLGVSYPDFPNFYTMLGPNTANGHGSLVFTNEIQANYIIQLIKPIIQRKVVTVEVKTQATDAYNEKIQTRLINSVFLGCHNWYRAGGNGKVTNIFPGSNTSFWLWLRKPNWNDYTGLGLEEWVEKEQKSKRNKMLVLTLVGLVIASGAFFARKPEISKHLPKWML